MPQFTVDDDLANLVERLSKQRPFENLSFNDALRRVLQGQNATQTQGDAARDLDDLRADAMAASRKKVPTPSPSEWVATVPELRGKKGLHTWRAICDHLKIQTAGDSARRKLKNWVKSNRPAWTAVPDID